MSEIFHYTVIANELHLNIVKFPSMLKNRNYLKYLIAIFDMTQYSITNVIFQ